MATTEKTTDKGNDINIRFSPEAWAKMWQYVFSVKEEISGYGKVEMVDGCFMVTDVAIFEQTVSGADTTINGASVAKFLYELHKRGEDATKWRLWWHSHNTMPVFWSGTDEIAMSPENNIGRDWLLSVVVNFKRHTLGRLDVYSPVHTTVDEIPVMTHDEIIIPQSIADEVAAKVTRRVYQPTKTYYSGMYDESMFGFGVDVPSRVPSAGFTTYMRDDMDELPMIGSGKGVQVEPGEPGSFEAMMLGEVLNEQEYLLCKEYYEGGDKLNKRQKKLAKKILGEWGVTINNS